MANAERTYYMSPAQRVVLKVVLFASVTCRVYTYIFSTKCMTLYVIIYTYVVLASVLLVIKVSGAFCTRTNCVCDQAGPSQHSWGQLESWRARRQTPRHRRAFGKGASFIFSCLCHTGWLGRSCPSSGKTRASQVSSCLKYAVMT